jgi:uncharacterized protein YegP (UPF0339 family)
MHDLKFDVYEDERREWRWTLASIGNGRKIADSGEGYKNHSDCMSAINLIKTMAPMARVNDALTLALLGGGGLLGGLRS